MHSSARRILSSGNLIITLILIGALFILLNYIASRRYGRWDFTQEKITALSDKTAQALRSLKEPITAIVFYQPAHRLYELVKDLLDEYARINPQLKVEYVDPEQDVARAKQLAQELQIESLNVVVFRWGSRHKYLSDAELAEYDYTSAPYGGTPRVKAFKGEEAFTSAILSVTQEKSPLLWFTSGHGEKRIDASDTAGLSELKRYLEQQNLTVETATLLEQPAIPGDVKLIVIAGATRRLTETELIQLQVYLEQGGRLLALADPLTDTGLDGLLERWGIALGNDIVVDPARQLPFVSAANLFVTSYTRHPIVEKMQTLMTIFPLARSVSPAPSIPQELTVTSLALTSPDGWGEARTSVETFQFDEGEDLKGPASIAAASEKSPGAEASDQAEVPPLSPTRLVVVGDSDFVANAQLGNVGNRDFFLGMIYWLIEQEQLIGIGPKTLQSLKLNLTGNQLKGFFWFSFLGMPLVCGALGTGMWWVRRR